MSRKQSITKEMLLEAAFTIVKDRGKDELSARNLAGQCGCSTQPIFRIYSGMGELEHELFEKCIDFFSDFYKKCPETENVPFVNLGLAYIKFASEYPNLFRLLFIDGANSGMSMYDLINGGKNNFVIHEIKKIPDISTDEAGVIFMRIWIFIHGMACMVIRDDFDMSQDEIRDLLISTYNAFKER